ncbi:MAG: GAF domain-containing protein [Methanobacterium sp.]
MKNQDNFKKSVKTLKSNESQFESINSNTSEDIPELDNIKKILKNEKLPPLKEISDIIMEIAKKATNSKHCYVAYVDPKNGDSVGVSFSHMTQECDSYAELGEARFPIRDDGTYGGLLGYSLDTGKSFYVHDPASHPAAHGMPPSHEQVDQFLSVPVIYGEDILGQIVLGNPEEDYTNHHLKIADKIANLYSIALKKLLY